jgi:hypothetical protein
MRADTEDHVPGRTFFRGRAWPANHVFPACSPCNAATRADEQLLSFVARMGQHNATDLDREEWERTRRGVANNYPAIYRDFLMTPNELRRAFHAYGLQRIPGLPLQHHPIIKLPVETFRPAYLRYGFKIGASLHYLHTRRIVAPDGGCFVEFRSNVDAATGRLPGELAELLPARSILVRAGKTLNEQFSYAFGTTDDGEAGAYLAQFRDAFSLFVIVGVTANALTKISDGDDDGGRTARPFRHPLMPAPA